VYCHGCTRSIDTMTGPGWSGIQDSTMCDGMGSNPTHDSTQVRYTSIDTMTGPGWSGIQDSTMSDGMGSNPTHDSTQVRYTS
jgi:hypothetical protein